MHTVYIYIYSWLCTLLIFKTIFLLFQLHIYDYSTSQVLKRVSKFPSHVYAASYRNDGRLLAVGSEDSIVRIVQVAALSGTSTILRQLPHKSAAVHSARFLGDNLRIASACDDGYVRLWNLATGSIISSSHSHNVSLVFQTLANI